MEAERWAKDRTILAKLVSSAEEKTSNACETLNQSFLADVETVMKGVRTKLAKGRSTFIECIKQQAAQQN